MFSASDCRWLLSPCFGSSLLSANLDQRMVTQTVPLSPNLLWPYFYPPLSIFQNLTHQVNHRQSTFSKACSLPCASRQICYQGNPQPTKHRRHFDPLVSERSKHLPPREAMPDFSSTLKKFNLNQY